MKNYLNISFFAIVLIWLSACNTKPTATLDNSSPTPVGIELDSIIKRGTLIAITNNSPTNYFIYRGRPMGYQYELLNQFAKSIGVKLQIKIVASVPDAIDSLKNHKGDILASGLTVLNERKKEIDFTLPIVKTHQVLIQRRPSNYNAIGKTAARKLMITDLTELGGKKVYVEEGSALFQRLTTLQEEIGDTIDIETYSGDIDIDRMMSKLCDKEIDYLIGEDYTANFFIRYYKNLDLSTPISFTQNIAWAVPQHSTALKDTINHWIEKNKNTTRWAIIYNKYFKHNKSMNQKVESDFTLLNGNISPYDEYIKNHAQSINWDWLLVAAQISTESRFNASTVSWAGATGLMQLMPMTAHRLGGDTLNLLDPNTNIGLGVKYNGKLYDFWKTTIPDSIQAIKFSLASYNIGKGHIFDAQRLASKNGLDPLKWDNNVELMIKNLSNAKFYRDPVVRNGYCRGSEAYKYVNHIFMLYQNYLNFDTVIVANNQ